MFFAKKYLAKRMLFCENYLEGWIIAMFFTRKATQKLKEWKEKYSRSYAALLEGPRRVGKSTIAEEFAKREYKSYILIDFSNANSEILSIVNDIANLDMFFIRLQTATGIRLFKGESAIIFDEIQLNPKARQAIKHLVKDGRYDYIETGSLLSIKKNIAGIVLPSEEYKIPVHPMDYEEFLWATGKTTYPILRDVFKARKPLGQQTNRVLMRDYRLYMAVGGMPQAVDAFIQSGNFNDVDFVKRGIIDLYEDDFFRIDPSGRISMLFESIPAQLAGSSKRFSLGLALNRKAQNKDFDLLYDLINSRTVQPCFRCTDPTVSLSQGKDIGKFKLYLADTGLFVSLILKTSNATDSSLYSKMLSDKLPANLGYLYENAVAQSITACGRDLYYMTWNKENSTHSYEIDFLFSKGTKSVPVEVKSSRTKEHESIDAFVGKYSKSASDACILSQKDIERDGAIDVLPFYLSSFLFERTDG